MEPPVIVLRDPAQLAEGASIRFPITLDGVQREAFVVRWRGELLAYVDSCRHQARSLSYGDGHVLDAGEGLIICRHHGARYIPSSGVCIEGPCVGARLTALALEAREGALVCLGRRAPHDPDANAPPE